MSWVVTSNVVSKLLSFGTLSFLARILNPAGLGMYSAVLASSASVNQICDLGTTVVLQRTGARKSELGNTTVGVRFTFIFLFQVLLNLLVSICIYFYPEFFNKTLLFNIGEDHSIQAIGVIAILQILSQVPQIFMLGLGEFRAYAFRMMLGNFIILLLTIAYVVLFDAGLPQVINAFIAAAVFNTGFTFFILKSIMTKHGIPLTLNDFRDEYISIFKEGFIFYLGNTFTGAIYNVVMLSLFAKYIGIDEYGFVRMGLGLVAILGILPAALQPVTMTFIAGKSENTAQLKSLQIRYIGIFSFIASVILVFFLQYAIQILFGAQYFPGAKIFIFIIIMNMVILLSSLISNFLVAKGYASYIGKVSMFCALLNILACFLLIPPLGLYGFFISYGIGYGLGFVFVLVKEFNTNVYPDYKQLRRLGLLLFVGTILIFPIYFIENNFIVMVYKGIYLLSMFLLLIPLSVTSAEFKHMTYLIKTNPLTWLRNNPPL